MGRKVARGSRGEAGVSGGGEGGALPTATSGRARKSRDRSHGSPIPPPAFGRGVGKIP